MRDPATVERGILWFIKSGGKMQKQLVFYQLHRDQARAQTHSAAGLHTDSKAFFFFFLLESRWLHHEK